MIDYASNLYIGAAPDHGNGGYFLGIIDDVRLYRKGFGSEDVFHLYRGDPGVNDYEAVRNGAKFGIPGTVTKITPPTLPAISAPTLVYGEDVGSLDFGESASLNYTISGLPSGLTNETVFEPDLIPGLFAWYNADSNGSLKMHDVRTYDRNDTVALENLSVYLPFDESNGSISHD